ncbi:MAG: T9SS type A sorting domain-containing protein, partial [Crocinitomicaceae bacterium]|nr:T9SS type A sorting domain-containing protein [Crocinitomicaceae bacterium]
DFTANCASAGFTGTSGGSALAAGDKDSLVVTTVFPAPSTVGNKTLTYSVDATETLENTYNDAASETIKITNNIMAADWYDGTDASISGTFYGWSAPTGGSTTIGNIMEVYEDGGISGVRVGVRDWSGTTNSSGNTLIVEIWKFNGTEMVYEYSFEDYIVDPSDIGTLAEVIFDEPLAVSAGDILYVGAGWYNGSEVYVMMSGESPVGTVYGTDGSDLYYLADPDPTETNFGSPVVRAIFIDNIGVEEIAANNFTVGQNIPNPFSANSTINYTLTEAAYVTVSFTDVTGKVVKTITPGNVDAGTYTMTVDGSDMAEGVYFYTFTAGDNKITKQMVVSKN